MADIVAATRAAADSGRPGCVYNVGGGERVALNDVLRTIGGSHRAPFAVVREEAQKGDMRDTFADTTAARRDLGFRSTVSLRRGAGPGVGVDPGARVNVKKPGVLAARRRPRAAAPAAAPDIATLTSNSDQVIWEAGQKAYSKKQWDNARQHYKRIIDGFPQSEYGPGARLGLGQTLLQGGRDRQLHPGRRRLPRVPDPLPVPSAERLRAVPGGGGLLQAEERPGPGPDATRKALAEYERLLELYPSSPQVEKARARIRECRQSLARAEFLAGYFYQRARQACRAAIARYEGILADYPDYERLDEVLFRLAECLDAAGRRRGGAAPPGPPARGVPHERATPRTRRS